MARTGHRQHDVPAKPVAGQAVVQPQSGLMTTAGDAPAPTEEWARDHVRLRSGATLPVRGTAPKRRRWRQLPEAVRTAVTTAAGSGIVGATSAGTGFTAGFASRLDLADGRRIFGAQHAGRGVLRSKIGVFGAADRDARR